MAAEKINRSSLFLPLWFGILALPFMGVWGSLKLSAAVFVFTYMLRYSSRISDFYRKIEMIYHPFYLRNVSVVFRRGKPVWIGLLFLLPLLLDSYQLDVLTMAGLYVLLALGLNIVVGFAGLLDLGYAAFYAVGAYSYALLSTYFYLDFWLALPLGGLLAGCFGFLLGMITLRLKGDYLAIVTLGFIQIIHLVLNNWDSLTRGPKGILGIHHPQLGSFSFNRPINYYYLILFIVMIAMFFIQRINLSRIGRAWVAIREDEIAAEAMGINTTRMKILAFVIGSAWAGVGGVFFAGKFGFVSPESFTFFESILILSMVVLGGLGSIPGVILGAVILMILPEMLRGFSNYRMLLFGLAMILMMAFRPEGIIGNIRRKIEIS
jgi:branched-chain amino acid transport system permease protein